MIRGEDSRPNFKFRDPLISSEQLRLKNWNFGCGSLDLLLTSATPYMSQERLNSETPARAVCAVHSMQPLPNYFGLLFSLLASLKLFFTVSIDLRRLVFCRTPVPLRSRYEHVYDRAVLWHTAWHRTIIMVIVSFILQIITVQILSIGKKIGTTDWQVSEMPAVLLTIVASTLLLILSE